MSKSPEEPLFKTLTEEEMKNLVPLSEEEIWALLEKGRISKEAAEKCWGSFRSSGIYFRS